MSQGLQWKLAPYTTLPTSFSLARIAPRVLSTLHGHFAIGLERVPKNQACYFGFSDETLMNFGNPMPHLGWVMGGAHAF